MIIILSDSSINKRAVAALIADQPQDVLNKIAPHERTFDDHSLTIVNLDANGREQSFLNSGKLAKRLIDSGLLNDIEDLNLLISDIVPHKSMLSYATELSQHIIDMLPDSNIDIHVLAELTDYTLIEPPSSSTSDWILYALSSSEMKNIDLPKKAGILEGNFDFYRSKVHEELYRGPIAERLKNANYTIRSKAIRETNDDEELEENLIAPFAKTSI